MEGHALTHNYFIVSNGLGQFYDQLGQELSHRTINTSVSLEEAAVRVTAATLDLDSAIIFYGGAKDKQLKIRNFLHSNAGAIDVMWSSNVSKMSLLKVRMI